MPKKKIQIHKTIISITVALLVGYALYLRIVEGRKWADWTGFAGKSLWDFMEVLIVPLFLAIIAIWFNEQSKKRDLQFQARRANLDREISSQQFQQRILNEYLDKMTSLLEEKDFVLLNVESDDKTNNVLKTAQVITVTALRQLQKDQQDIVIQFLRDAGLHSFLLKNAFLAEADLSNLNLEKIDFSQANLNNCNLENSNLLDANFSRASLQSANLKSSNLMRANCDEALLQYADMRECVAVGISLQSSNLKHANLSAANFGLRYIKVNPDYGLFPIKWELHETNFTSANLADAILYGVDLEGAILEDVEFSRACLDNAILKGANLENAHLEEVSTKGTNFDYANLKNADLINVDLSSASLEYSNLEDANLAGCKFIGAKLRDDNFAGAYCGGLIVDEEQMKIIEKAGVSVLPDYSVPGVDYSDSKDPLID